MQIPVSGVITISEHVLSQQVSGETVLLDLAGEQYFGLDVVGTRIWELLTAGCTPDEIMDTMIDEFDVSRQQLQQDFEALLTQLLNAGLVQINPAAST